MQRKTPLSLAAALVTAGALLLTGCSAGSGDSSPSGNEAGDTPTTATIGLTAAPANLDFTTTAGAAIPQALMANVYETLIEVGQDGELKPLLATDWETSEDGKTYTFQLQEGVTFSNGEPFTAEDVKFSFERVSTDWTSTLAGKMAVIESIEVLSDTEVAVTLSRPSYSWLWNIATPVGAIFSTTGVDDLANNPIGTGPYEVSEYRQGESLSFTARDDYWGEGPGVEAVTLRYFADATASTNALRTGDIDAIVGLQAPELVDTFEADDTFDVISGLSNGEVSLSLNNTAAPFDDVRIRQAVLYAIDRQAIIDTAWNGYGSLVSTFVPEFEPYYVDLNDTYAYNPEKAKELLAEAGAENLDITFTVPTLPYAQAVSEIIVSQLKDVGINVTIESSEFPAVWLDQVFSNRNYDMTVINHVEGRDLFTILDNPDYYIGYDNSKIAPLIAEADASDEAGFNEGMKKVQEQIVADAPHTVLFLMPNLVVKKSELQGLPENAIVEALDLTNLGWN